VIGVKIGVLALQGAFAEHRYMLRGLGVESVEIRRRSDFSTGVDGLIIPGGESTVMQKLLRELGLLEPVREAVFGGMPVFATCAGLILLSKEIDGGGTGAIPTLNVLTRRNAYGRQLGSFQTAAEFRGFGQIPMIFIRAPYVLRAGEGVQTLAVVDGNIVAVRQGTVLATAFHPELTDHTTTVHEYFLRMCLRDDV
jgi:5'-phosphate synthase pdxT subunit